MESSDNQNLEIIGQQHTVRHIPKASASTKMPRNSEDDLSILSVIREREVNHAINCTRKKDLRVSLIINRDILHACIRSSHSVGSPRFRKVSGSSHGHIEPRLAKQSLFRLYGIVRALRIAKRPILVLSVKKMWGYNR